MRRLACAAALGAALCAAAPAAGYERITTDGDPTSPCLWWGRGGEPRWAPRDTSWLGPRGPVWQLSTAHAPAGCGGLEAARALAREAFAQWSGATRAGEAAPCTDFTLAEGPDTAAQAVGRDGTNLVVFRSGDCADVAPPGDPCLTEGGCGNRYNCWESDCFAGGGPHCPTVLALTWNTMDLDTGEIVDSDIELQDWNGDPGAPTGWYFTCAPAAWGGSAPACSVSSPWGQQGCTAVDVGNTLTHEVGHVVGLDHVPSSACGVPVATRPTMCASAPPGTLWMRTLSADEVEGVCAIYPRGQPTLTCAAPPAGCGCGGAASWPAILVALSLLRRVRRREP
jgi:hypothetical protein